MIVKHTEVNMEKAELEEVRKPRRWVSFDAAFIVLIIAIAVALVFVIKLAKENAALKARLAQTEGNLAGSQSAQPGDIVPGFKSVDIAGQPMEIVYDGSRRYLIYLFAPSCDICVSEIPIWNRIAEEALSQNYKVFGISLDSLEDTRKYMTDTNLLFDVSIMPGKSLQRAYRVVGIPEVLIVSGDGIIEWVHYGPMTTQKVEEMLAKL